MPETVFPCRDGRGRATEGELTSEVSKLDTASVMMMADVDHDKVGKLIRLLSDQDGEPLAAARALRGTLHRGGRDFHWLAERVSGGPRLPMTFKRGVHPVVLTQPLKKM